MKDRTTPKKLTPAIVAEIERMFAEGRSNKEIARTINRKLTGDKGRLDGNLGSNAVNTMRRNGRSVQLSNRLTQ